MSQYDAIAAGYDSHFRRPVDHWEDERLAAVLRPIVGGRDVLDLGCGTGWVLDHCDPAYYTGVDCSAPMLAALAAKHPGDDVTLVKATIGQPGWADEVRALRGPAEYDIITCTWALQYFGDLTVLLPALAQFHPEVIALHGYLPRYRRRRHEITGEARPVVEPWHVRGASMWAGLPAPHVYGTGSLPDGLARSRAAWEVAARLVRAEWHWAALWTWWMR